MRFKDDRIKKEYSALAEHNPKLYKLLFYLDQFCLLEYTRDIMITSIFRTEEEHKQLYAQTPEHKRPASSPHMHWNAADIRSRDFEPEQKYKMLRWLNCWSYKSGQGRPTAILHTIAGNVEHFHIQSN